MTSQTSIDPTYGYTAHLPGVVFEDARSRVADALTQQGFGILTEIDVQATLKTKLDLDFRRYVILGACNPTLPIGPWTRNWASGCCCRVTSACGKTAAASSPLPDPM